MILEDAELCLEGFQLNNREKGSHRPEYADQEEKLGRKRNILPTALPVI